MTEIIDSFRVRNAPGRSKAVTLFVLTTLGSFGKLIFIGFWVFLVAALEDSFGSSGNNRELKWITFTGLLVILFGLINFAGSLLMLKRIKAGLWIYLVSQAGSLGIITYTVLALSHKLTGGTQFFLGLVWVVTGVFVALYLSNMQYYSRERPVDETFFESENEDNEPQYPQF